MRLREQSPLLLSMALFSLVCAGAEQYPKNMKLLVLENLNSSQIQKFEKLGIEVEVFDLSLLSRIESALSVNLSADPQMASKRALKRIESNYHDLVSKFEVVVKSQNLIERFDIDAFPAAVVDNTLVIYGTVNPHLVIRKWRARQLKLQ